MYYPFTPKEKQFENNPSIITRILSRRQIFSFWSWSGGLAVAVTEFISCYRDRWMLPKWAKDENFPTNWSVSQTHGFIASHKSPCKVSVVFSLYLTRYGCPIRYWYGYYQLVRLCFRRSLHSFFSLITPNDRRVFPPWLYNLNPLFPDNPKKSTTCFVRWARRYFQSGHRGRSGVRNKRLVDLVRLFKKRQGITTSQFFIERPPDPTRLTWRVKRCGVCSNFESLSIETC